MKTTSTRRGFLKSTTGAGLLICSSRVAFGYQANERLNIAAIGVGGQGEGNVNNVSSENIVALCEVDTNRGARSLAKHSKAKHYQDFRRMLDEMDKQ
ncbi:MAG: gfo/Idh/MocA family oxidoreductase, partial [Akkermansiaceae bacterium]